MRIPLLIVGLFIATIFTVGGTLKAQEDEISQPDSSGQISLGPEFEHLSYQIQLDTNTDEVTVTFRDSLGNALPFSIANVSEISVGDIKFEDMNFDGYMDATIFSEFMAGNAMSSLWIFNPRKRAFEEPKVHPSEEDFSELPGYELNPNDHTLETDYNWHSGAGWGLQTRKYHVVRGEFYLVQGDNEEGAQSGNEDNPSIESFNESEVYSWRDIKGRMKLIESTSVVTQSDSTVSITKKMIRGKLTQVKRSVKRQK